MRLLIDQVVSMPNPGELNIELDSLLDGVNSVRKITHETRHMIEGSLDRYQKYRYQKSRAELN